MVPPGQGPSIPVSLFALQGIVLVECGGPTCPIATRGTEYQGSFDCTSSMVTYIDDHSSCRFGALDRITGAEYVEVDRHTHDTAAGSYTFTFTTRDEQTRTRMEGSDVQVTNEFVATCGVDANRVSL